MSRRSAASVEHAQYKLGPVITNAYALCLGHRPKLTLLSARPGSLGISVLEPLSSELWGAFIRCTQQEKEPLSPAIDYLSVNFACAARRWAQSHRRPFEIQPFNTFLSFRLMRFPSAKLFRGSSLKLRPYRFLFGFA